MLTELLTSICYSQGKMQLIHTGLQHDIRCHTSFSKTNPVCPSNQHIIIVQTETVLGVPWD
jgi:hypothetical protein